MIPPQSCEGVTDFEIQVTMDQRVNISATG